MDKKQKKLISYLIIILLSFLVVFRMLNMGYIRSIDSLASQSIQNIWSNNFLNSLMIVFSDYIIYYGLILLSILIFGYFIYKHKRAKAIIFAVSMSLGFIIVEAIKLFFHRIRPFNSLVYEAGFSFPSSHSTMAAIFFLLLIYLFKDSIKNKFSRIGFIVGSVLLILLTGFSRIFLNVHWLSDVIAGFVLGGVVFVSVVLVKEIYKIRK